MPLARFTRRGALLGLVLFSLLAAACSGPRQTLGRGDTLSPPASAPPAALPSLGGLPLVFVISEAPAAPVQAESLGGDLTFEAARVSLALPGAEGVAVRFVGAEASARPAGEGRVIFNEYGGRDPANWHVGRAAYGALTYTDLYPGIDLRYDGQAGALKGTYHVAAGADPALIRWQYEGARDVALDPASGDLLIHLDGGGTLTERAPLAWQDVEGKRVPVEARYRLDGGEINFVLGDYDPALPLVIDPTLVYATYLGRISADYVRDAAVDGAGNVYVAGWTYNSDLGGFPNSPHGSHDAYAARLNAAGTAWEWVTYFGGGASEEAYGLAVVPGGVWVTGYTNSTDFPTTANAHQDEFGGYYDVMLVRLNAATGAINYSSLYGFESMDEGRDVAVDGSGNAYVTGKLHNANVLALKMSGGANPAVVYDVQWGDDYGEDEGYAIAVDGDGQVYIAGETEPAPGGSTFPLENAVQSECGPYVYDGGSNGCTTDAFVSVLNPAGDALVFSTLLGGSGGSSSGSGTDEAHGIALDAQGSVYVTGLTYAADFPTVNAAYGNYPDPTNLADAWVTKFSPAWEIVYSTYLGGESDDEGQDIAVDAGGAAFVLGFTRSDEFPAVSALQPDRATGGVCYTGSTVRACYDSFVTKLAPSGQVAWSTYLGGGWDDYGYGLALNGQGGVFAAGLTESDDYPTTNGAAQADWAGNEEGFVAKLQDGGGAPPPPVDLPNKVYVPAVGR